MKSIVERLSEPFPVDAIHWRAGATNAKKLGVKPWEATKCIALAYINARDVMNRLDAVCGDGWQVEYPFDGCCRIGLKIDDEWVWRSNGAGETDVEGEKGRYSDAFKRAAVLWGVGRYLYALPNTWCDMKNGHIANPPKLPNWAVPNVSGKAESTPEESASLALVTPEQAKELKDRIHETSTDTARFLQHFSGKEGFTINSVDELPQRAFKEAISMLNKKVKEAA